MNEKPLFSSVRDSITEFLLKRKDIKPFPPRFESWVRHPYGPFRFQLKLRPGAAYQILASTNLEQWSVIDQGNALTETLEYVDSDASKFSYRFYRAAADQLPSENVIGYANVSTPPGFTMIANPLVAADNRVAALFPSLPEGSTLNKFDAQQFRLTDNSFADGKWSNPDETLRPGEGAIFRNPTEEFRLLTFAGEVMQGNLLNPIAAGFSIRSSMVPQAGRLHTDLGFPAREGDVIHLFDKDQQKYNIFPYDEKQWQTAPPIVAVGESFWVGKTSAGNWVRSFRLNQ